jgi:ABC-2 type transport system ATP-binding protein
VGILRDGALVAVDTVEGLREAAGTEPTLRVQAEPVSAEALAAVRALEGVERASMADGDVVVGVADSAKFRVLETLEDHGAHVTDFETTEASLEELFLAYTEGER